MFKPLPNTILSALTDAQIEGLFAFGDQIPQDQRGILVYTCRPA